MSYALSENPGLASVLSAKQSTYVIMILRSPRAPEFTTRPGALLEIPTKTLETFKGRWVVLVRQRDLAEAFD